MLSEPHEWESAEQGERAETTESAVMKERAAVQEGTEVWERAAGTEEHRPDGAIREK